MGAVKNAGVALLVGVLASGALTGGSLGTAAVATTEREPTPVVTQEPAPTPEPTSTPATTSTPAPTAEPTPAPFDDDAEPEKSLQQELTEGVEEIGEQLESVKQQIYGSGKNPKLAIDENSDETPTTATQDSSKHASK